MKMCAKVKRGCRLAKRWTWNRFLNYFNPIMDVRYIWNNTNNLRSSKSDYFSNICVDDDKISHP